MIAWLQREPWQLFLLLLAPVLLVAALYSVFAPRSPTELTVAFVDQDHSALSRALGRALQATPAAKLQSMATLAEAAESLRSGQSYALVMVPADFSADLRHGLNVTIEVRYNGSYLLMARRLLTPLQQAIAASLQQPAQLSLAAKGMPLVATEAQLQPVQVSLLPLNNIGLDYAQFLLPPLALAVWQLCALLAMINLLNRPAPWRGRRSQLSLLLLWQALLLALGMALLTPLLALPQGSHWWPLWLAALTLLLPLLALALLLYRSGRETTQQASVAAALLSPAFAYMGVTMPTVDMPLGAQWWGQLIPSTHYLPLLQQFRASASADWWQLWPLLLFTPLVLWLWRKLA
ncbi:ABC transporter permease [Ferrimonas senticii]|uniref:ABC transporter permease n=1 Tax=Ferrimonas senticii TaxID=394566 RepID=UPI0003F784C4|nr:ABC transporter permease [Ferrimonas senticii]